jgi:iron complex outermembrane recepter protein
MQTFKKMILGLSLLGICKAQADTAKQQILQEIEVGGYIQQTAHAVQQVERDREFAMYRLAQQDLPAVFLGTPAVLVTQQGGGYGDSRLSIRGFGQDNIAVVVNGIVLNDVQNGSVYWSNLLAIADFMRAVQLQKGLSATSWAANAIGGALHVQTYHAQALKGGSFSSTIGSNGYFKQKMNYSTGILPKNWLLDVGFSFQKGDGYVSGTDFEVFHYFASLSKFWKNQHINLTVFGAPQSHGQRTVMGSQQLYQNQSYTYNAQYGQGRSESIDTYHKPFVFLSHHIDYLPNLKGISQLYYTSGRGGSSNLGVNDQDVRLKNADKNLFKTVFDDFGAIQAPYQGVFGELDWQKIKQYNSGEDNPWDLYKVADNTETQDGYASLAILKATQNEHDLYGAQHQINWTFLPHQELRFGVEGKYYFGRRYRTVSDLLGGDFFQDTKDKNNPLALRKVGDKIDMNYNTYSLLSSAFALWQMNTDKHFAFAQVSVQQSAYQRLDFYNFTQEDPLRKTPWKNFWAYTVKMGYTYKINAAQQIYINAGHYTKPPYLVTVFSLTNQILNNAKNEKTYATELGYKINYEKISWGIHGYFTLWQDKFYTTTVGTTRALVQGIHQRHIGVEMDLRYAPVSFFALTGSFSYGDWRYVQNVHATLYEVNNPNNSKEVDLYIKNLFVSDAPRLTAYLGFDFKLPLQFFIHAQTYIFALQEARFNPEQRTKPDSAKAWTLPAYYRIDTQLGKVFSFKQTSLRIWTALQNLTNHYFIQDAIDGQHHNQATSRYFYAAPLQWTLNAQISF